MSDDSMNLFGLDEPAPVTRRPKNTRQISVVQPDGSADKVLAIKTPKPDHEEPALWEDVRPEYRPPAKADDPPKHGLIAVSTFSGGGGSSLGMSRAGWTIPYSMEFIPQANETYRANFPTTYCDPRDIRETTAEDILNRIGLDVGELDLFEGSPPCSSFSRSNSSKTARFGNDKVKTYSDGVKQSTDDLFEEWMRLALALHPKALLAENVPALGEANGGDSLFTFILSTFNAAGYDMRSGVFYADRFGAATSRARLFIYGIRRDQIGPDGWDDRPPVYPYSHTLAEAIATCPPSPADELEWVRLDDYATGRVWAMLKPGEAPDASYFNLIRSRWDRPMATITATGGGIGKGAASVMHPDECRYFTATEAAWCTGFPSDYINLGTPGQRYERIARAVPPPMYDGMGTVIARALGATK